MEFPLFTLSTNPDTAIREYHQPGTNKHVRIIPPVIGAATVFDKDLLLFIGSQIIEGRKAGLPISNTVIHQVGHLDYCGPRAAHS
jgi:hypothetical protein